MKHMGAAAARDWSALDAISMFTMWWVMMIAMMLPSATPTILLSAALNRRSRAEVAPYGNAAVFTLGYLMAWAFFSLAAVALQWWLERAGVLSMHMESVDAALTGGLLLAASGRPATAALGLLVLAHCVLAHRANLRDRCGHRPPPSARHSDTFMFRILDRGRRRPPGARARP